MNSRITGLFGLVVGLISGSIGAAVMAAIRGETIPIPGIGLSDVLFWGGVYGASSGLIVGILSNRTDYASGTGLEWGIIGAFAALTLILATGQRSEVMETIHAMSQFAIPAATAGWFTAKRIPDTIQRTNVTRRTFAIYLLGIVSMPTALFCSSGVLALLAYLLGQVA